MAGKARRAAARQGELSRKKKRGQRGPSGIPAAPARIQQQAVAGSSVAVDSAAEPESQAGAGEQPQAAVAVPAAASRPTSQPAALPRGQGRVRGERPAAYNYVGSELRRIAVLSTAVLAALVVLSFVI